jgi:hypothetical protein
MNLSRFCDLAPGTHFKHEGLAYVKVGQNLARNERRERTLFPSNLVVEPCQGAARSSQQARPAPQAAPSPAPGATWL